MSEVDENVVLERFYTIPLWRAHLASGKRRAPKAVKIIKAFMERHMKPEGIIIEPELNEEIWSRGIKKSPRRIRVRATKDDEGIVTVRLAKGE